MKKSLLIIFLNLFLVSILSAQVKQTGSIKGSVLDDERSPLPGVSITVTGPSLLGSLSTTTGGDGTFRVPVVPPGKDYVVVAELEGFQTIRREGVIVSVGMTVTIIIEMKPSKIEESVTVVAASPTVDVAQSKTVQTITTENLEKLPLARDFISAYQIAAGVADRSIHGSGNFDTGLMLDGIQLNEPDNNVANVKGVSWDIMEEMELITAGAPAEAFHTLGGFLNIVTKSGGNRFSGGAQVYYTQENLAQILYPDETLEAMGIAKPISPISDLDTSFTLGGPVMKDKIWFFGSSRYLYSKYHGDFKPTTILGKRFEFYDREGKTYYNFGKLTFQISKNLRAFVQAHYETEDFPLYYSGWNKTDESNRHNIPHRLNYSFNLSWILGPNTFVDARFGGSRFDWDGKFTDAADPTGPRFIDSYTGYQWGNDTFNGSTYKIINYGSVRLTRFQDNFLGGDHEIKIGFEIQRSRGDWGFYRQNPMYWYYYNENPYYYRGLYGLNSPHPVYGDGRLSFIAIGPEKGDSFKSGTDVRYGGFIQDSWTIQNRLTINLGFRYDTYNAWMPEMTKKASGTQLARAIGETYFLPKYGFNPYDDVTYERWDDAFPYKYFSPNIGISYDIFGDGKTAAKATYARQSQGLTTGNFTDLHPIGATSFNFYWWDLNNNGQPDLPGIDKYQPYGTGPLGMLSTAYRNAIDPDIKIMYSEEFTLALEHELAKDFKVGAAYIDRRRKNVMSFVLYDVNSGRYWNTYEKASDWWVPFATTIPAYGGYPASTVTMYFQSKDAPDEFDRFTNIPEAKNRYQGVELTFNKRMSHGWQLGGSVVFSKLKGTYDYSTSSFRNPNYYVNRDGDLSNSRPLLIKLFGTFTLPYRFLVSFFYRHEDGAPWNRTVTVVPPAAWAAANNAETLSYGINVEVPGTRRGTGSDIVDLRLEKEFSLGRYGRVGMFMDVFNLMGYTQMNITMNPGGTWKPADVNTPAGTYTPAWTGITGHTGTRVFKFSVRYTF